MFYTPLNMLPTIELSEKETTIPLERLIPVLEDHPSNIIYCLQNKRLFGIITMGSISRALGAGERNVRINKNYIKLLEGQYLSAREIFNDKTFRTVNAIPVVDAKIVLKGEYTRWNDVFYASIFEFLANNKSSYEERFKSKMGAVVVVQPQSNNIFLQHLFCAFLNYLKAHDVCTIVIDRKQVRRYAETGDLIVFVDEDEFRGTRTLFAILGVRLKHACTCKSFTSDWRHFRCLSEDVFLYLLEQGVQIYTLTFRDNIGHYRAKLEKEIHEKYKTVGLVREQYRGEGFMTKKMKKEFYQELFTEDYSLPKLGSVLLKDGIPTFHDIDHPKFHIVNGERVTVGQPIHCDHQIFVLGPCFIIGVNFDDQHTIESQLQESVNESGLHYKVINGGVYGNARTRIRKLLQMPLNKGDIIVVYLDDWLPNHITGAVELIDAFEQMQVPSSWFSDQIFHFNHKVAKICADAIYNSIKWPERSLNAQVPVNLNRYENIVKLDYLNCYFANYSSVMHGTTGAIVMNCNPFTLGHRYLIEKSLSLVDTLIIFVVQDDPFDKKPLFSFEERYTMVSKGTSDLKNVIVVPSGYYILSQTTFPEYFAKVSDEELTNNTEYDIELFATQIAPRLNITYRFAGEEPEDEVTNAYNAAMKRILPLHGVKFVEIPRKQINGKVISASSVRQYLKEMNMERLKELVPKSTIEVMFASGDDS